ncbi:MAG: hypothetical protein ACOH2N_00330 [Devosia sp.]
MNTVRLPTYRTTSRHSASVRRPFTLPHATWIKMTNTFDLPAFIATLAEGDDYAYKAIPDEPGDQLHMCFTEQGMRKFLATSDTPRARQIETWIDSEVLPTFRNGTGLNSHN